MPRISPAWIQTLQSDGFVTINRFLDERTLQKLISEVESLQPDPQASRVRRGVAFARRNLLELDFVRSLIADTRVAELISQIDPGLIAVRAILFDKTESANWTVPWHQDRSIAVDRQLDVPGFGPWSVKAGVVHVQPPTEILHEMVTLRFHLDPCDSDNGPLRVIARTHGRILNPNEIENEVARSNETVCVVDAGGLLIMRPLILHASSPAAKVSHRRIIHIEFGPKLLPHGLNWAMAAR